VGPRLVVTTGDPRGIGPEVAIRALDHFGAAHPTASVGIVGPDGPLDPNGLADLAERFAASPSLSSDDEAAGTVAARAIERAVGSALAGDVHAIVTPPLHKPSLHAAGWNFAGQTEMLSGLTGVGCVGMLMAAETTRLGAPLRVLLATTHLPLRAVVEALTEDLLVDQITLLANALRSDWGIDRPRIAMCALNPHASDGGLFGDEEERIVSPALARTRQAGIDVCGPLPADTVFTRALDGQFDAVVAPYHDVGMAAFKTVSFGTGVNVTIGLPFIRTSPDHGTAFDIAGTGKADATSMVQALELAHTLAKKRFDMGSTDV